MPYISILICISSLCYCSTVEQFFNRKEDNKTSNPPHVGTNKRPKIVIKTRTDHSHKLQCQVKDKVGVRTCENVLPKSPLHSSPHGKRKIIEEKMAINQSSKSPNEEEFYENAAKLRQDKRAKTCAEVIEVTERPDAVSLIHDGFHILSYFLED